MKTILIDKAKELLKASKSADTQSIASILISKSIEHSETDIRDFVGAEKPYNKVGVDQEAKVAVACNLYSMLVVPFLFNEKNTNKVEYPYKKIIPDLAKCKTLKLIDDAKLLASATKSKLQELITGTQQFINVAEKGELFVTTDNAIKMFQFGTSDWKSEGKMKPLVKQKDNKTMLLMPSISK